MFFLKKLLQYIEQKGFRAGMGGADKRSVVIAAPTKPAGRAVRRENGEQGFAGNRRGRVAAESVCAAGGDRRAEAERFAWYFAVRGFFARSAREKGNSRATVAVCRRGAGSAEETLRAGQCLRGSALGPEGGALGARVRALPVRSAILPERRDSRTCTDCP